MKGQDKKGHSTERNFTFQGKCAKLCKKEYVIWEYRTTSFVGPKALGRDEAWQEWSWRVVYTNKGTLLTGDGEVVKVFGSEITRFSFMEFPLW